MRIARVASLAIALGEVVALAIANHGFTAEVVLVAAALLLPLALIWFPEQIGGAKGYRLHHQYIDEETPPVMISLAGWFFLVGLPAVLWYLSRRP